MIKKAFYGIFWPINTGALINNLAAIITILSPLFGLEFLNQSSPTYRWIIAISIGMSFFVGRFFYLLNKNINALKNENLTLEQQVKQRNIWGDAIVYLRTAYSHIHFLRKKTDFDKDSFLETMIDFCDILQEFYNKKTDASCCVSIKIAKKKVNIEDKESLNTLIFENLCRDSQHPARDNNTYKNTDHTVIGNTPYSAIISKMLSNSYTGDQIIEIGYIHNDVRADKNYRTTSINSYDNKVIPYESELVYPLIPFKRPSKLKYIMIGFLCIDCNSKDKFVENNYELPMISGVADGLYDILLSYLNEKKWKETNS